MAPSQAADDELQPGRIVAGRYRIEALLGRGGMGRVYRAVDEQLGRGVALKLLAVAEGGSVPPAEAARRMVREARAAAAFTHPNAVAVYDVGELDGAPFLAMELVRGRSLREHIGDAKLPVRDRLRWLGDVARALAAAHRAGLVHRDVKPDNVIVADDGTVKLLDFGIARRLPGPIDPAAATDRDGTITVEGTLVGTPAYMAPEQLRAEKVDGRADQFSWAVMAWELLAGRKPWVTTNAPELIAAVLMKPAPPLVVEGVPPAVAAAIGRALSKQAGDRFPTMDALVGVLQGERPAEPSRRLPLGAALVAFALVALAAIGVTRLVHRPGATTTVAAAPKPGEALLRFPCPPARRAPDQPECGYGLQAWCDPQGQQIACCREGLAPLDRDGVCDCPPGGSMSAPECAKPPPHSENYGLSLIDPIGERIADCPRDFARDVMDLELHIDPDGRAFGTRIAESHVANAELQRCVLDKMRGMTFAPPPGGFYSDRIPLSGVPVVAPLTGPLRFPCPDPSKVKLCQLDGEIPWCDADGKWLACCAKPLAALGKDGMCGCPPGGTTGGAGGCPTAKYGQDYEQLFVPSLAHRAITLACGRDGLSVGYDLEIDPDGRVFKASIAAGASADVELQRCVLTALRRMHADPPPDGNNSVGYGAIYKFEHRP